MSTLQPSPVCLLPLSIAEVRDRHPPERDAHDAWRAGGGARPAAAEEDPLRPDAAGLHGQQRRRQGDPHRGVPGMHASLPG